MLDFSYMKKILIAFIILFSAVVIAVMYYAGPAGRSGGQVTLDAGKITNFEECVAMGNAVMESFPRQCRTEGGLLFVEKLSKEEKKRVLPRRAFGERLELLLGGEMVVLEDESELTLTEINDSRCPEDAVCVWEGELSANVMMDIRGENDVVEIQLGSVRTPEMDEGPYRFTLVDITEEGLELIVTKNAEEDHS